MENSEDRKSARSKIKTKVLEAFKEEDKKNNLNIFTDFYPIINKINKVFK
ncbi:hypothetical protein [Polaribacter staleyi]